MHLRLKGQTNEFRNIFFSSSHFDTLFVTLKLVYFESFIRFLTVGILLLFMGSKIPFLFSPRHFFPRNVRAVKFNAWAGVGLLNNDFATRIMIFGSSGDLIPFLHQFSP